MPSDFGVLGRLGGGGESFGSVCGCGVRGSGGMKW